MAIFYFVIKLLILLRVNKKSYLDINLFQILNFCFLSIKKRLILESLIFN